jgi:hypothetical protein
LTGHALAKIYRDPADRVLSPGVGMTSIQTSTEMSQLSLDLKVEAVPLLAGRGRAA